MSTFAKQEARAQKSFRENAKRYQKIRAVKAAHRKIRASGRVVGQEARAKVIENRKARKAAALIERVGYANTGE